jgi:hypothetical protein
VAHCLSRFDRQASRATQVVDVTAGLPCHDSG